MSVSKERPMEVWNEMLGSNRRDGCELVDYGNGSVVHIRQAGRSVHGGFRVLIHTAVPTVDITLDFQLLIVLVGTSFFLWLTFVCSMPSKQPFW